MDCVSLWAARSISLNVAGGTIVGGPSSKIFWKRLCVEQSRPLRATAFPWASPTIWTSMCRAFLQSCIINIGEPGTSLETCTKLLRSSSSLSDMRIPFPPPPSEAFSMTGYPIRLAASTASSAVVTMALLKISFGILPVSSRSAVNPSPDHGMEGTSAVWARMLAAILSPSRDITRPSGPMNLIPSSLSESGSSGFSDAWPHPGQTASTFFSVATLQMSSTLA
mmetsp:Transcript_23599/g.57154  ORF Transcript_23599/g.57154 Transcript_23599/m.57154 type:complete len:223 (+) Transcript_23599:5435-6103(+)